MASMYLAAASAAATAGVVARASATRHHQPVAGHKVLALPRRARAIQFRTFASSNEDQKATSSGQPAPSVSPVPAPAPVPAAAQPSSSGSSNGLLAAAAVGFGAAVFMASRVLIGGPSFAAMEDASVPLDAALSNGRPTIIEFYASWCEVCRELLPTTYEVEKEYKGKVNFVMLNVDNSRWRPELLEYGVAGIPHFVFLDEQGKPQAAAVGRLPREVLESGADALATGRKVPFARVQEETSPLQQPNAMAGPRTALPRDHA